MHRFNSRELRQWFGLTWADLCVYLALAACVALFIGQDWPGDALLALTGFSLTIASCALGMRSDPEFEDITNIYKALSYPAAVMLVAVVIFVHYPLLGSAHSEYAGRGYSHAADAFEKFFRPAISKL